MRSVLTGRRCDIFYLVRLGNFTESVIRTYNIERKRKKYKKKLDGGQFLLTVTDKRQTLSSERAPNRDKAAKFRQNEYLVPKSGLDAKTY
jgi:hypothetical protein